MCVFIEKLCVCGVSVCVCVCVFILKKTGLKKVGRECVCACLSWKKEEEKSVRAAGSVRGRWGKK